MAGRDTRSGVGTGRQSSGGTVRMPLLLRLLVAALSGLCVAFAFQPYAIWPLTFVGVAGLTLAAHGTRPRRAFLTGYVFGLAMLTVAIGWVRVIVGGGAVAYLGVFGLVGFEALAFGLLAVAITVIGRLPFWPVMAAAAWTGVEYLYSRYPFGGFGWTRIAYTVVGTPLDGLLPMIGVAGLSFTVALLAQSVAWLALGLITGRLRRLVRPRLVVAPLALWVGLVGAGFGLQHWNPDPSNGIGEIAHVGIVQGNVPGEGIDAMGRMRTVTANHVAETEKLIGQVDEGRYRRPDFILWPENSTDIDPTADPITADQVETAAVAAGKPIFVGAVMNGPGPDERQTSGLWWDPKRGIIARYDKRNLVPFGEWIPFRKQLLPHFPILQLVGPQSVPGTKPGALRVPITLGGATQHEVVVGDAICFELAYDDTIYDVINSGAEVFMVQSNNATYTGTGQVAQQFAITRARAMETRREIAVATTNGVSGFIGRDGRVEWQTAERTAAATVVDMPLRTAITPAVRVAPWLDRGLAAAALVCCIAGVVVGRRQRRAGSPDLAG
ncbi:apolipoprotein N-acyltransferase [Microlunatus sp. Gsoil 973]|uniref:apolipoprotein N-acyltransferase n=1 Tax=Microlunatus sp. Gsoil 973 TaxID=2672569 RepID=UPI0012B47C4E|nr:apolipoprotein N-acyltransferase [Microlunatus sp. Gsoil 973]QGN32467.1 apolipoprotein N-acyltransferase [Microlunatus sp. Gsoil 973]